ncbi:MAG TPA: PBP1A family penicillin-binding protein [Candidatus Kapabacteria bacterium]|nr:PBP1A family penicillin-binding protein [Candidatus Kapabacteria bacterium]
MPKHWWLDEGKEDSASDAEEDSIPQKPRRRRSLKRWQIVLGSSILLALALFAWLWIAISRGMPTLDQIENPHPELATQLISADGERLDQYYIKNRTSVELKDVPRDVIAALIATEDRDFYHHWGINLWGIIRAAGADLITLSPRQGASTITQQLARNLYLTQQKSIMRKLREMASAIQIERMHTKNEILEMYLNVAYFGRGAYGIEAASQVFFGKDVSNLTTDEGAYLIGVLKGPENYDPIDNYDRAVQRRNLVLNNMVETKYLSPEEAQALEAKPLKVQPMKGYTGIAPHFVEMIRQELSHMPELAGYDLYRDGLVVYTTLNATMQRAANRAVEEHIEDYQKNVVDKRWNWASHQGLLDSLVTKAIHSNSEYHFATPENRKQVAAQLRASKPFVDSVKHEALRLQCGFVCLDQTNGQILAMVGSSNFDQARYGLNHVTQIERQPGSAFKPILYASCFEHGATPETLVSNEPVSIPDGDHIWSPGNFEGEAEGGERTIRQALQYSVNLCAVHAILELTTPQDVVKMAHRLGIRSNIPPYPSIALGSAEVTPLELTSAYSTFANEGVRATPYAVVRVEDRNGKVLYRAHPEFDNVLEPRICHMMTSALSDVVNAGTAVRIRSLGFHFPAAGKTGTTQNFSDAWFVGYTPQYTAGVWVGFDDKRIGFTGADGQGGRAAAPIWGIFMKSVYDELHPPLEYFTTSYSNVASPQFPGQQTDSNAVDTNQPNIELHPLPNAPNHQPNPGAPVPGQPLTVPKGRIGESEDTSSEDIRSVGQLPLHPAANGNPALTEDTSSERLMRFVHQNPDSLSAKAKKER